MGRRIMTVMTHHNNTNEKCQTKIRLNGDPKPEMILHSPEEICNCKWYNRPKYFNGTIDAMLKISRLEGPRSLWSGLSPTLVLTVPNTIIYFTTYEQLRHKFGIH